MPKTAEMPVKAIAPWFGGARMIARDIGQELVGCRWVGVPFAGGMSEIAEIQASSIAVNDLHRHVINLARCIQDAGLRRELVRQLSRVPFHPDVLKAAQEKSRSRAANLSDDPDVAAATEYFIASWMGRSHKAGTVDEFNGGLSTRWNGNGGDSNTRYRSAVRSIGQWGRVMRRCNFSVLDCFEFLEKCEDLDGHGIYCDPPFPEAGQKYRFSFTTEQHSKLADVLAAYKTCRVVCRFYDHPLIRKLYPADRWEWRKIDGGRKQTNGEAPEVLVINGESYAEPEDFGLFSGR